MAKLDDLTGQKFDYLRVLEKAPSQKRRTYWKCQCDCGNIVVVSAEFLKRNSSVPRDCGCSKRRKAEQKISDKEAANKYLVGKRFGRLTVIDLVENKRINNSKVWLCQCDCGNIKEVPTHLLTSGGTKSCGCLKEEDARSRRIDITGQKFGKLTAIYPVGKKWHCKCDCGNECEVDGYDLRNGITQSCGCINYSIGEYNIKKILDDNNISYIKEYTCSDLDRKRFDFAIKNEDNQIIRLIEFDGEQHYFSNRGYWKSLNPEKELLNRQQKDQEKNRWAKQHHIPLVRIPYWERNRLTLDLLMGDKYLVNQKNTDYSYEAIQ